MEDITGALAIIFIFGAPVAAWIVSRVLRHQEQMEYLRRGMVPPPHVSGRAFRRWYREVNRTGATGVPPPWPTTPTTPAAAPQMPYYPPGDDPQHALFKGIRTAIIGLGILLGVSFFGGTWGSADFHGGPWLLLGLVPMFVGIAQIIIAVLSGAQLPGVGRTTFIPPPPPGPSAGPRQPQPGAPWQPGGAWQQPGRPHVEELSKPTPPPDRR
jgi:hypothetical protein